MNRYPVLLIAVLAASGCGDLFGVNCTTELRPNLLVQVNDSSTGAPAAIGATGWADRSGEPRTELLAADSQLMVGLWRRERAGRYVVGVRKPGFRTKSDTTDVTDDRCHVRTKTIRIAIARNTAAIAQSPVRQTLGARTHGSTGSAGIRVLGDTLEIVGSATVNCAQLSNIVAFRSGEDWHIQLEHGPALSPCPNGNLQSFELRYLLPAGRTELLVTNAAGGPVVMFQGSISRPQ